MQRMNRVSEMRFRQGSFGAEFETMSKQFNKFESCCRMHASEV